MALGTSSLSLSSVSVAAPASASAAYADWLTALGVADAAAGLDGDDGRAMFTGVPWMSGASSRMVWGSEGGIGLYDTTPANEAVASYVLSPDVRNYFTASLPKVLLLFMDAGITDRGTFGSRKASSADTLLVFATVKHYGGTGNAVDVALRVTSGLIEIVVTNVSATNAVIRTHIASEGAFLAGTTIAQGFSGTVAYHLTPASTYTPYYPKTISSRTRGLGSGSVNSTPKFGARPRESIDRLPLGIPQNSYERSLSPVTNAMQFKGRGQIVGTVKEKASPVDTPVRRRVRLYREPDGLLVRTVWSDPATGVYEFSGIPLDAKYTVVSHDYAGLYRAVLADNLAPELIP